MINCPEWTAFALQRCNELHRLVFDDVYAMKFDTLTVRASRLAYAAYHAELNRLGFGRDEAGLPQLQSINILQWGEFRPYVSTVTREERAAWHRLGDSLREQQ